MLWNLGSDIQLVQNSTSITVFISRPQNILLNDYCTFQELLHYECVNQCCSMLVNECYNVFKKSQFQTMVHNNVPVHYWQKWRKLMNHHQLVRSCNHENLCFPLYFLESKLLSCLMNKLNPFWTVHKHCDLQSHPTYILPLKQNPFITRDCLYSTAKSSAPTHLNSLPLPTQPPAARASVTCNTVMPWDIFSE